MSKSLFIVGAADVRKHLAGQEHEIVNIVRNAYLKHEDGNTDLPHSTFLNLPGDERNRIIALPAYIAGNPGTAGIKWISSIPHNTVSGIERASAILILNSVTIGKAVAVIEASMISAWRTAASAALAAQYLHANTREARFGVIGCGVINKVVLRFIETAMPIKKEILVYDIDEERAQRFCADNKVDMPGHDFKSLTSIDSVLSHADLISFATTAIKPHVVDLSICRPGATILHISLRDIPPQVIKDCDNVVDDIDHVCRANTSLHLAEQLTGGREFIRCTLAKIMKGEALARTTSNCITVFSPFGLGILDVAVGQFVLERALSAESYVEIDHFYG